jgi:hypothetical protein
MPQLSLYMDKSTFKKVTRAVKGEKTSISRWVATRLMQSLKNKWPENYFETFGSIRDPSFQKHESASFALDSKREFL